MAKKAKESRLPPLNFTIPASTWEKKLKKGKKQTRKSNKGIANIW